MKRYIIIYIKQNIKIALIIGVIPFILMAAILLFFPKVEPKDALSLLIFPAFGLLYFLWSLLYLIGFRNMIREQEKRFDTVFDGKHEVKLAETVFTAEKWLIFSGKYAFYHPMIQNITSFKRRGKRGLYYSIVIHTVDGEKYTVAVVPSLIPKIKTWFQKLRQEENARKHIEI